MRARRLDDERFSATPHDRLRSGQFEFARYAYGLVASVAEQPHAARLGFLGRSGHMPLAYAKSTGDGGANASQTFGEHFVVDAHADAEAVGVLEEAARNGGGFELGAQAGEEVVDGIDGEFEERG